MENSTADMPTVAPYDVIPLDAPFHPSRYIAAIEAAENSGAGAIVVDSGSHEWEGPGGVLDMAGDNEERTKKAGLHNWKKPKFEHALLVSKLLRVKVPIIVCLRAKYKSRQGKNDSGATVIFKDDKTSPIQADDFIFEATAHAEILPNHSIILTKCSHPNLRSCFPTEGPICVEHGRKIAEWCLGSDESSDIREAKRIIWDKLKGAHKTKEGVQQFLWDEALMELETNLETASLVQLRAIVSKLSKK